MAKEKKEQVIDQLQQIFEKCNIGVLTDYKGLTSGEINTLRRKLRESGVEYKVVKNTLARLAVERLERKELGSLFEGQTAIAFGYGDAVEVVPRALADYVRAAKSSLSIKGGFLGARLLTAKDVTTLSTLPSREVLLAQAFAGLQGPIVALVSVLSSPISGIMGVLQARIRQLEGK